MVLRFVGCQGNDQRRSLQYGLGTGCVARTEVATVATAGIPATSRASRAPERSLTLLIGGGVPVTASWWLRPAGMQAILTRPSGYSGDTC